jgi:hypothetical protein
LKVDLQDTFQVE